MDTIAQILNMILTATSLAVIGRALISFVDPTYSSTIGKLLYQITEPIMAPIRRILPQFGGFDLSPIIVLIGVQVLRNIINNVF